MIIVVLAALTAVLWLLWCLRHAPMDTDLWPGGEYRTPDQLVAPHARADRRCARILTCTSPDCGCRREVLCTLPAGHAGICDPAWKAAS